LENREKKKSGLGPASGPSTFQPGDPVAGPSSAAKKPVTTVTPRVTLFSNYLHYKLSKASSAMVNQVVEV
jgi:hypothetical protein